MQRPRLSIGRAIGAAPTGYLIDPCPYYTEYIEIIDCGSIIVIHFNRQRCASLAYRRAQVWAGLYYELTEQRAGLRLLYWHK
jgi:hypothetical protein